MSRDGRAIVAIDELHYTYADGTVALRGVDLRLAGGERTVVVGQNGSGKSTLVRHLNGLLRATSGSVSVDGAPVGRRHVADLARVVGMAFQNPDRQIFAGTVRREVEFGPRNVGVRDADLRDRVDAALDAVGLAGRADTNPYDLGYSQRKLLALASILAMRTPVIVLDEPTTGQDARGTARVRSIIQSLSAEGRTVLAVSHDMRFVAETFPRVVVMRTGQIILDGPPDEVFAEQQWDALASSFLEPPLAARLGASAGLGPTPTERSLIEALRARRA